MTSSRGAGFSADRIEKRAEIGLAETAQPQLVEVLLPAGRRDHGGERMLAVDLGVTVRANDQDRVVRDEVHDVIEHGDRAAVRPMEVVEDDDEGRQARDGDHELCDRIEQPHPLLVRAERRRLADVAQDIAQPRGDAGEDRGSLAEGCVQLIPIELPGSVDHRFGECAVRGLPFALVAGTADDGRDALAGKIGEFLEHAGLADARLPAEHHDAALAVAYFVEPVGQAPHLAGAADERRALQHRERVVAFVEDLTDLDGARSGP